VSSGRRITIALVALVLLAVLGYVIKGPNDHRGHANQQTTVSTSTTVPPG
jgi:hypothetical protein